MTEFIKPQNLFKPWARLGNKREPIDSKKDLGYVKEIPTCEDFNWLEGRQDDFIAHTNQRGVPQHDMYTPYIAYKSYVQGSNGNVYLAKTNHFGVDPVSDTTFVNWALVFSAQTLHQPTITLTLQNNFNNHASYPVLKASVRQSVLWINGAINIPVAVTGSTVATLPVGYRPSSDQMAFATVHSGSITGTTSVVRVETSGNIVLLNGNWNAVGNNIIFSTGVIL